MIMHILYLNDFFFLCDLVQKKNIADKLSFSDIKIAIWKTQTHRLKRPTKSWKNTQNDEKKNKIYKTLLENWIDF